MSANELSPAEQIREIRAEFYDEAESFKNNRSKVERQIALNHINALLDAYHVIQLDLVPQDGMGVE